MYIVSFICYIHVYISIYICVGWVELALVAKALRSDAERSYGVRARVCASRYQLEREYRGRVRMAEEKLRAEVLQVPGW